MTTNDGWELIEDDIREEVVDTNNQDGWELVNDSDSVESTTEVALGADSGWELVEEENSTTNEAKDLENTTKDNKYLTFDNLKDVFTTVKDTAAGLTMATPSAVATAGVAAYDYLKDDRSEEEKKVGEVLARSQQLSNASATLYLMTDAVNRENDSEDRANEAYERAAKYLLSDGTITNYSLKDKMVKLPDGKEIPFESSFFDSIIASKYETIQSVALGVAFPAYAKYTKAFKGVSTVVAATTGSAVGASSQAVADKIANAKFFGETLDNEELVKASVEGGYDDLFFGSVIESLVYVGKKSGGKLLETAKAIKDKIIGSNYKEALDVLKKKSSLDDEELESLFDTASFFWNEKRLSLDTKEGQKQAIRWMAQYDTSIFTSVAQANSSETISNVIKQMIKRTSILKSGIKKGDSNIARDLDRLKQDASINFDAMVNNLNKATSYANINPDILTSNLTRTMKALSEVEGVFGDKSIRQLNNFRVQASRVTTLGSVAKLYKTYNNFLRGVDLKSLDKDNMDALLKGKEDIKTFLESSINTMEFASKEEKASLIKSFSEANNAYRTVMRAIDTDLYDAVVSGRKVVGNQSKELLDSMIASAKKGYLGVDLDETSKILNILPKHKSDDAEAAIMGRIIEKNMLEREGKISDFKYITEELHSIRHIFRDEDNVKTISNLDYFEKLWQNDENMIQFIARNADDGQLSAAGISKSPIESAKYASNSRLFQKLQEAIPAILKKIPFAEGLADVGVIKDWKIAAENKNVTFIINEQLSLSKDMPDFINRIFNEIPKLEKSPTGISLKKLINNYMKRNEDIDKAFPNMRERMEGDNQIINDVGRDAKFRAEQNNVRTSEIIIPRDLYIENIRRMKPREITEENASGHIQELIRKTGAEERYTLATTPQEVMITNQAGETVGYVNYKDVYSNESIARQVHAVFSNIPKKAVPPTPQLSQSVETSMSRINEMKGATASIGNNTSVIRIEQGGGSGEFTFRNNGMISGYTLYARQGTNAGSKIYKSFWDSIDGTAHKYKAGNDLTNSNTFRMTVNQLQYIATRGKDAPNILLNSDVQIGVPASLNNEPLTVENAKTIASSFKTYFNRNVLYSTGVSITENTSDAQLKEIVREYGNTRNRKFGFKTARLIRNFARTGNLSAMSAILIVLSNQEDLMKIIDNNSDSDGNKKGSI